MVILSALHCASPIPDSSQARTFNGIRSCGSSRWINSPRYSNSNRAFSLCEDGTWHSLIGEASNNLFPQLIAHGFPSKIAHDAAVRKESKRTPIGAAAAGIVIGPVQSRAFVPYKPDNCIAVIDLNAFKLTGR